MLRCRPCQLSPLRAVSETSVVDIHKSEAEAYSTAMGVLSRLGLD